MINQTTTKYLGQIFYFYYVCVPALSDVVLQLYNTSNALITTLPMTPIGTTGVYRVSYLAPNIGTYVGVASSATAAASSDIAVKTRASSVTELIVVQPPANTSNVTISNAVGVGVKCD